MTVNTVVGSVVCVSRYEVVQVFNEMKTRKSPAPSDVSLELIADSWEVGIQVNMSVSPR